MNITAQRSRADLREALLALMREKPFKDITVTEVCKRANLDRSTFYQHYKSCDDIIDELQQEQLARFRDLLNAREESGEALIKNILDSVDRAKDLFQFEAGGSLPEGFQDGLVEIAKEHGLQAWRERIPQIDEETAALSYEAFLAGALRVALSAGRNVGREKVVAIIMGMLDSSLRGFNAEGNTARGESPGAEAEEDADPPPTKEEEGDGEPADGLSAEGPGPFRH